MPKPKLPDEDKKEVVPLRLPKEAVAALHGLALDWGEKRGKEIKPATVARELVLIGLGVLGAVQDSKMLREILKDGDPDQASRIRRVLNESTPHNVSPEQVAHAMLKIVRDEVLLANPPIADRNAAQDEEPIPTETIDPLGVVAALKYERSTKKGGR